MAQYTGTVGWFNNARGFGFLRADNGSEIHCHYTAIEAGAYTRLKEGTTVEFDVEESEDGPRAVKVRLLTRKPGTP